MAKGNDRINGQTPGKEIPRDYREVVIEQITRHGFRYEWNGKGYPRLYPPDGAGFTTLPRTPSDKRGFRNMVAWIRRHGGEWPPARRQ